MAFLQTSESDSDEYHSSMVHEGSTTSVSQVDDSSSLTDMDAVFENPKHPVALMQGAFEESIRESAEGEPLLRVEKDAEARRHSLLEASVYDDAWRTRWQQTSAAQHHPLRKLMAQIIFGMHLLQQQQAKSNEEVVSILQTHVNEVDGFLERTADDFDLAITDIEERIEHLRLPMAHLDVFRYMLGDPHFRTQLLEGNQKIEDIIDRTFKAMNATLLDIQHGIKAAEELAKYMDNVSTLWPKHRSDIAEVFSAMRGNEQGWLKYLRELPSKGARLSSLLHDLRGTITDMAKMASHARNRDRHSSKGFAIATEQPKTPRSPDLRSKFSPDLPPGASSPGSQSDMNKPLPTAPARKSRNATSITSPPQHSSRPVSARKDFTDQQLLDTPKQRARLSKATKPTVTPSPQRPKTAGSSPPLKRNSSADLAEFLKTAGPLRSNPPEHLAGSDRRSELRSSSATSQARPLVRSSTERMPLDRKVLKPALQGATTMLFLNSPPVRSTSTIDMQDEGRAMSIRSAPGLRKDGNAFARRISARMKSLPFSDDRASSFDRPKFPAPLISAPIDFRVIDSNDGSTLSNAEFYDAAPSNLPSFSKSKVASIRSQSIRSSSFASTGRSKLRNIFQRGWKPREPTDVAL